MKTLVIILLLLPTLCFAWDKEDTALQATVLSLFLVDMSQTLYISSHDEYIELNPILGEKPSRDNIFTYFLCGSILHTAISYALPKKYRRWWQGASIIIEGGVVIRNSSIGIGFSY